MVCIYCIIPKQKEEERIGGLIDALKYVGTNHNRDFFCSITTKRELNDGVTIVCSQTLVSPINEDIAEFIDRVAEIKQVANGELKVAHDKKETGE